MESKNEKLKFVLHEHDGRTSGKHYDLRFQDPDNPKEMHSFAIPSKYNIEKDKKLIVIKTRMHDIHWLTYESYRAKIIDTGDIEVHKRNNKSFTIILHGEKLKGKFAMFKLKNTKRESWIMMRQFDGLPKKD